MAQPVRVAENFDLGFQSDTSRDQLPKGAAYRMKDYIPELDAPARKRGGWGYASADLNALSAATYMSGIGWVPAAGDGHLISISDAGKVYRMTTFSGAAGAFIAASHGQRMTHRPIWHKDRMILPAQLGAAAANVYKYYDAGTLAYTTAVLGGTPPQARVAASWGDYLILANGYVTGTLFNNRIWFSGVGNPESWVLTGSSASFIDAPREVVGVLPLRSVILVWGYQDTWMYTGDTPPPGGNMARVNLFTGNGCMDGRSVASYREYAIWANNSGVWKTDGATLTDMTKTGGISNYYRSVVGGFSFQQGWSASGGVYAGRYFLTIRNAANAIVTTLICDIDAQTWTEAQNINATMYAERPSSPGTVAADGHEELFFSHATSPRAAYASSLWTPSIGFASDADGTPVQPVLETPYYKLGTDGTKRARRAYVDYDIRTAGGSPYIATDMLLDLSGAYIATGPNLVTTTEQNRRAVDVRRKTLGVAFRLTQVGASADTRLYSIDLEGHSHEGGRRRGR